MDKNQSSVTPLSVSVRSYGQNITHIYMYLYGTASRHMFKMASLAVIYAVFELVAHEESAIWTSLSHSFTKEGLL